MIINHYQIDTVEVHHIVSEMASRADIREAVNEINPNAVLPEYWPKARLASWQWICYVQGKH